MNVFTIHIYFSLTLSMYQNKKKKKTTKTKYPSGDKETRNERDETPMHMKKIQKATDRHLI